MHEEDRQAKREPRETSRCEMHDVRERMNVHLVEWQWAQDHNSPACKRLQRSERHIREKVWSSDWDTLGSRRRAPAPRGCWLDGLSLEDEQRKAKGDRSVEIPNLSRSLRRFSTLGYHTQPVPHLRSPSRSVLSRRIRPSVSVASPAPYRDYRHLKSGSVVEVVDSHGQRSR